MYMGCACSKHYLLMLASGLPSLHALHVVMRMFIAIDIVVTECIWIYRKCIEYNAKMFTYVPGYLFHCGKKGRAITMKKNVHYGLSGYCPMRPQTLQFWNATRPLPYTPFWNTWNQSNVRQGYVYRTISFSWHFLRSIGTLAILCPR